LGGSLGGRAFYEKYGLVLMEEKAHAKTGFGVMRLKLSEGRTLK